jgi:predicted membrane protein
MFTCYKLYKMMSVTNFVHFTICISYFWCEVHTNEKMLCWPWRVCKLHINNEFSACYSYYLRVKGSCDHNVCLCVYSYKKLLNQFTDFYEPQHIGYATVFNPFTNNCVLYILLPWVCTRVLHSVYFNPNSILWKMLYAYFIHYNTIL